RRRGWTSLEVSARSSPTCADATSFAPMRSSGRHCLSTDAAERPCSAGERRRGGRMPGEIVHFEIPADDTAKAREFWGGLFGWQFESYPGPSEYHMTRISDQSGAAITNMEPGKRGARAYFAVDDINAGAARVKELGGEAGAPAPVP